MSFIKNIVNSFFLILFCYLGGFLFRVGEGNNAIFYFFQCNGICQDILIISWICLISLKKKRSCTTPML